MITCRKTYRDIPFAHRQPGHDGHCAFIHGHNWTVTITFACHETDANGFVVDYGKLKYLRAWLDQHLDHACVFREDDPLREALVAAAPEAWKIYLVADCSNEGLARHLCDTFDALVRTETDGRAWVTAVEMEEDSRNAARYEAPAS